MQGSRTMLLPTVLALVIGVGSVIASAILLLPSRDARAESSQRTSTELKLSSGRKLVDVSWRCFGDYPCRPFLVTRAMRQGEAAETYDLFSPYEDAPDAYVIKESR